MEQVYITCFGVHNKPLETHFVSGSLHICVNERAKKVSEHLRILVIVESRVKSKQKYIKLSLYTHASMPFRRPISYILVYKGEGHVRIHLATNRFNVNTLA